eukprot:SAG25_NODE_980_length_4429_cov_1.828176_5_plen_489_part_00
MASLLVASTLLVAAAAAAAARAAPKYTATRPNYQKPLGGLPQLPGALHFTVFTATPQTGTYNHQPMLARHGGSFHVAWKASAFNEDQDGQRILYASSADGKSWSEAVDIFPSMPAHSFGCDGEHCWDKIHHECTPFVTLYGRLYAVSNLRRHGSPGSFYPTPALDMNTTMLRQVLQPAVQTAGGCAASDPRAGSSACPTASPRWTRPAFGPMLWATAVIPAGYANVSQAFGLRPATDASMTPQQRTDLTLFRDQSRAREYTPDSCRNGPCNLNNSGEQTVYSVKGGPIDTILYRGTGGNLPNGWPGDQGCANPSTCVLLSSSRNTSDPAANWSAIAPTNIPDLGSNLNAGSMDDGRVFLTWNGIPRPHVNDSVCRGSRPSVLRNPLTLALSNDGGEIFGQAWALFNSTVSKRYCGSAKPFGPSYPQSRQVVGEGKALDGLWTVCESTYFNYCGGSDGSCCCCCCCCRRCRCRCRCCRGCCRGPLRTLL